VEEALADVVVFSIFRKGEYEVHHLVQVNVHGSLQHFLGTCPVALVDETVQLILPPWFRHAAVALITDALGSNALVGALACSDTLRYSVLIIIDVAVWSHCCLGCLGSAAAAPACALLAAASASP
jgi:hypothetical protein